MVSESEVRLIIIFLWKVKQFLSSFDPRASNISEEIKYSKFENRHVLSNRKNLIFMLIVGQSATCNSLQILHGTKKKHGKH